MIKELNQKVINIIKNNEITQDALFRFNVEERLTILSSQKDKDLFIYSFKNICLKDKLIFLTDDEILKLLSNKKKILLGNYDFLYIVLYVTNVKTAVAILNYLINNQADLLYFCEVAKYLYLKFKDDKIYLLLLSNIVINTNKNNISNIVGLIKYLNIDKLTTDFLNRSPVEIKNNDRIELIKSINDYNIQEKYITTIPKNNRIDIIDRIPDEDLKQKHLRELVEYDNIMQKSK